jgi:hypothetical protein
MGRRLALEGQRFGRLSVISLAGVKNGMSLWLCHCDCGKESTVIGKHLRTGNTKSCGCLQAERRLRLTHGHARRGSVSRTFSKWRGMIRRCTDPRCKNWKDYGGRGIGVCDRWLASFENFLSDMGEAPAGLTIERIDNSLGYEPGNCRWETVANQCRNRRSNRWPTYNGRTQCESDWALEMGVHRTTLRSRLSRGWPVERALTAPVETRYLRLA